MRHTQLFTQTIKDISKEEVSLNAQLLLRAGFVDKLSAGIYTYLPLGLRVLTKIENIIREEMNALGAQEVLMPALQPKELWDTTERWNTVDVLFKLKGSGDKDFALGATHEEVVTPLVQRFVSSYKQLPIGVYQIQTKFRNEARAKSGLLRGREFRMKDLYSFHTSQEDLDGYYDRAKVAYMNIYKRCGLGETTMMVYASGGAFSKYSHEYQTFTEAGEDHVYVCESCHVGVNKEILEDLKNACPECGKSALVERKAIEVGNIFKLSTRFSDAFGFKVAGAEGQKQIYMGCYGIGSSRLMGSIVEVFHDAKGMLWPEEVAPFAVHLVSLCKDENDMKQADALYEDLKKQGIEVLYDDRDARAGEKFADSDLIGIPARIVVSAKTLANKQVEVKKRTSESAELVDISNLSSVVSV